MILALFILFALLQVADGITTIIGLRQAGVNEANPIADWLMDSLGQKPAIIISKLAIVVFIAWLVFGFDASWAQMPWVKPAMLVVLNLTAIYVVWSNIKTVRGK